MQCDIKSKAKENLRKTPDKETKKKILLYIINVWPKVA